MPDTTEVNFSSHLKRFIELPESFDAQGTTVREIIEDLEANFSGISGYLLHENGKLRQHVNVFLDDAMVGDRTGLSDSVKDTKTIFVMQALSGG